MAKNLVTFLKQNPVDEMVQDVYLGGRLAEFPFKIKPLSANQFYKYQQICTVISKNKDVKFNSARFNELIILNHVVEPNFRDAELLSQMDVKTPEELLGKYFLGGEVLDLAQKISDISGLSKDDEELEEEVKNS